MIEFKNISKTYKVAVREGGMKNAMKYRSLAEHSKREGISMNQYCVYLLSKNDAVYSK